MSIPVSKNGNIEPHQISCEACHGEVNGLTLGVMFKAEYQGRTVYADRDHRSKTNKAIGEKLSWTHVEEGEKLVMGLCDKCKQAKAEEEADFKAEIAKGGIYWSCEKCSHHGVIKGDAEVSRLVREETNIAAPDPVGITFQSCEEHAA